MSSRYVLWGSAGHAKVLGRLVRDIGGEVIALFDNSSVEPALSGVPIFLGEAGFDQWAAGRTDLNLITGLVAIGGSRGRDRVHIHNLFRARGMRQASVVHPRAWVCDSANVGSGSQVLALASVAANAQIGEACIINHGANVDHECVLEEGVHLAPSSTLCGCVTVRRTAMIGAGAVVLPRITVGEGAIVGAGAVVTRDVEAGTVVVGAPARPSAVAC